MNSIPPAAADGQPAARRRRGFTWYVVWALIAALLLGVLYTVFMLWYSYSEGERAGVLQKFSRRGWICKTYEGEIAMYVVGGVAPQIWHFSVRDPETAAARIRELAETFDVDEVMVHPVAGTWVGTAPDASPTREDTLRLLAGALLD